METCFYLICFLMLGWRSLPLNWKLTLSMIVFIILLSSLALYRWRLLVSDQQRMIKATYDKSVLPARIHCPVFVNRKDEIKNVTNFLNFHSSNTQVVNVVGSPSFGKSCIAINVGHDMIQQGVTRTPWPAW